MASLAKFVFSSVLFLVLLGLAARAQQPAPTCPGLPIKVRAQSKAVALGGVVSVAAKVRNVGAAAQHHVAIQLTLPEGAGQLLSATAAKTGKTDGVKPGPVAAIHQTPNVYWLPLSIPAGKRVTVYLKAKVSNCPALAGTTLAFGGLVYQTNATGAVTCITPAQGTVTKVKALKTGPHSSKTAPPSACVFPSPDPGSPVVLIGQDQVLVGGEEMPLAGGRRRSLTAGPDEKGDETMAGHGGQQRELVSYKVDDCYEACSFSGKYVVPFYMSFYQSMTSDPVCFCSQSRLLAFLPGFQTYRVDAAATQVGAAGRAPFPLPSPRSSGPAQKGVVGNDRRDAHVRACLS